MTVQTTNTPGIQITSDFTSQLEQSIVSGLGFAVGGAIFAAVIYFVTKRKKVF